MILPHHTDPTDQVKAAFKKGSGFARLHGGHGVRMYYARQAYTASYVGVGGYSGWAGGMALNPEPYRP